MDIIAKTIVEVAQEAQNKGITLAFNIWNAGNELSPLGALVLKHSFNGDLKALENARSLAIVNRNNWFFSNHVCALLGVNKNWISGFNQALENSGAFGLGFTPEHKQGWDIGKQVKNALKQSQVQETLEEIQPQLVAINSLVRRQVENSPFTHWDLTDDQLLRAIEINFKQGKPGYRDGVLKIPIPVHGFYTGLTTLVDGDNLIGYYKSRQKDEEPRKSIYVKRDVKKVACQHVEVILYRHDVLAEDDDAETDAQWEVVSVNGSPSSEPAPIEPMTLIANHFHLDGGTQTSLSPEEFEKILRESIMFWKNHARIAHEL